MTRPLTDRTTAVWLGLGFWALGTLLLWDAYENRGRRRPFGLRLATAAAGLP